MRRIRNLNALMSFFCIKRYRRVVVNRETNLPVIANDNNPVLFCRLMSHKTPGTTTGKTVEEFETGTYRVFCLIEFATVVAESVGLGDRSKQPL